MDQFEFEVNELGRRMGIVNIRNSLSSVPSDCKILKTKVDKLGRDQKSSYINKNGLIWILRKSRKKDIDIVANSYGIKLDTLYIPSTERTTLDIIIRVFAREKIIEQYKVDIKGKIYYLDVYFPEYKLAIECDENHHKRQNEIDIKRQEDIEKEFNIAFLRYIPNSKEENIIYNLIRDIYNIISDAKVRSL